MQKVPCADCGVLVLPQTANANGGMCAQCGGLTPEYRAWRRDYQRRVDSGEAFRPDDEEIATAIDVHARIARALPWMPQPEFYAGKGIVDAQAALLAVPDMGHGGVHLVTERGDQFELSLSALHGVVAVTLDGAGTYYALTPDNILSGLPREQHVERGCPCCGVGIHSYASRFHMPRARAIDVARDFLAHRDAETTRWLEIPPVFFDGRDWA